MRAPNQQQGDGNWFAQRIGKLTASRMISAMKRLKAGETPQRDVILRLRFLRSG